MSAGSEEERRSGICRVTGRRLTVGEQRGVMDWWLMGVTAAGKLSTCSPAPLSLPEHVGASVLAVFATGRCQKDNFGTHQLHLSTWMTIFIIVNLQIPLLNDGEC